MKATIDAKSTRLPAADRKSQVKVIGSSYLVSLKIANLRHTENGSERDLAISGAFIAIGHEPQSQLVSGQVETDAGGYVVTQGKSTLTNVPGVFASGDLVDHTYRQAITAAGSGCQAALDAEWYLRDTPFPLTEDMAATA